MQPPRALAGELVGAARRVALPRVLRDHAVAASLGALLLVQWLAVLAFALTVRHNGWLYYQGGDQLWHYTTAWLLAHGELPFTTIGFAWPLALLPIAGLAGPQFLDGLPAIVLLNVLVLLPAAVLALYALGNRLGGRAVGLGAAAFWVAAPWLSIPLFDQDYHEKWVEQFLPQATGLTAMPDLPVTVALLAAALLTARALDDDSLWAGAAAGLAAGAALAVKPSVAIALPAFALALAAAGRWRSTAAALAALALPLLALAVWKARGVGYLPAFASGEVRLAAGGVLEPVGKYVDWSLGQLQHIERDLRGEFFSVRLVEVAALGGILALARRTVPGAVLVGGWFLLVVVFRAGSSISSIDNGSFFRYTMPAFPALCLLVASLALLVPTLGRRLAAAPRPPLPSRRTSAAVAVATAATFTLALGLAAAATPLDRPVVVRWDSTQPLIPVVDTLAPVITASGSRIDLRWSPASSTSARTFYRVFRGRGDAIECSAQGRGALYCTLAMQPVGETRGTDFTEVPPETGRWVYRVSVASNWLDDPGEGDPTVMSAPVAVTTR
jgi:hypothetical protein